jgi:hypothetical protein
MSTDKTTPIPAAPQDPSAPTTKRVNPFDILCRVLPPDQLRELVAIIQELCAHRPLTAQEQGALEASRRILAALQRRECGTRADRLESPVRSYARRA